MFRDALKHRAQDDERHDGERHKTGRAAGMAERVGELLREARLREWRWITCL